jgi:hypothetical protein
VPKYFRLFFRCDRASINVFPAALCHSHAQELKSSQPELPSKVKELITNSPLWDAVSGQADKHASVPGLTITSFHYEQVAASKKV